MVEVETATCCLGLSEHWLIAAQALYLDRHPILSCLADMAAAASLALAADAPCHPLPSRTDFFGEPVNTSPIALVVHDEQQARRSCYIH
jgi:hypothetical protein